ncbi:MAG: PHP domain-containing protein, partial [Flavobacteriales bacterium]
MYLSSHSYYSLRYGTIPPEELLQLAAENDIKTLALTDINNTSACLDFIRLSKKYNIRPAVGIDFRNKTKQQFIGLAKNNEGYYELNLYLSKYFESGEEHPERAPSFSNAYVIYPFNYTERSFGIADLNENEYIGIRPDDLNRLKFHPWRTRLDKLVMVAPITFRNKRDFNAHRLLRAIDNNTLLSKLPKEEEGNSSDQLLSGSTLRELFQEFPEIIQNTERLLGNCEIHFEFGSEIPPQNLS